MEQNYGNALLLVSMDTYEMFLYDKNGFYGKISLRWEKLNDFFMVTIGTYVQNYK